MPTMCACSYGREFATGVCREQAGRESVLPAAKNRNGFPNNNTDLDGVENPNGDIATSTCFCGRQSLPGLGQRRRLWAWRCPSRKLASLAAQTSVKGEAAAPPKSCCRRQLGIVEDKLARTVQNQLSGTPDAGKLAGHCRLQCQQQFYDARHPLGSDGPAEWAGTTASVCKHQYYPGHLLGKPGVSSPCRWVLAFVLLGSAGRGLRLQQDCCRNAVSGSAHGKHLRWKWVLHCSGDEFDDHGAVFFSKYPQQHANSDCFISSFSSWTGEFDKGNNSCVWIQYFDGQLWRDSRAQNNHGFSNRNCCSSFSRFDDCSLPSFHFHCAGARNYRNRQFLDFLE